MDQGLNILRNAAVMAVDMAGYPSRDETDASAATAAISALNKRVDAAARLHGGRVFGRDGDGVLIEFAAAAAAAEAAVDILFATPSTGPQVRIGLHLGAVREGEAGALSGDAVDVATALAHAVLPGRAFISHAAAAQAPPELRRRLRTKALRRQSGRVNAFVLDLSRRRARGFSDWLAGGAAAFALMQFPF